MKYQLAAATAGIAYAVSGAAVIGHQVPDSNWGTRGALVDVAGAVAFAATAIALTRLTPMLAGGRTAAWASRIAQIGLAAMTIESIASLVHGGNTLGPVFFLGLLLALGGTAALGYAGVRARRLTWAAPLPLLALLVAIAGGDRGGFVAAGIVWLVLAAAPMRASRLTRAAA
ncbi:MAG TPA: hypothetical protein VH395_03580 [Jatrophihabitantaceae bacterium]|jgi:hypothetical protein